FVGKRGAYGKSVSSPGPRNNLAQGLPEVSVSLLLGHGHGVEVRPFEPPTSTAFKGPRGAIAFSIRTAHRRSRPWPRVRSRAGVGRDRHTLPRAPELRLGSEDRA